MDRLVKFLSGQGTGMPRGQRALKLSYYAKIAGLVQPASQVSFHMFISTNLQCQDRSAENKWLKQQELRLVALFKLFFVHCTTLQGPTTAQTHRIHLEASLQYI